jgi:hypothetical protein
MRYKKITTQTIKRIIEAHSYYKERKKWMILKSPKEPLIKP